MEQDLLPGGCQLFRCRRQLATGKVEIIGTIDWHQVEMGMGNFQSYDGHAATITIKRRFDRTGDGLRKRKYVCQQAGRHIEEIVHF